MPKQKRHFTKKHIQRIQRHLPLRESIALIVIIGIAASCVYYLAGNKSKAAAATCITASQSWYNIGSDVCVEFRVGYTFTSNNGDTYLDQSSDYSSGFNVYIPADQSFGANASSLYANKQIEVNGLITNSSGSPAMAISDPNNIQIVQ